MKKKTKIIMVWSIISVFILLAILSIIFIFSSQSKVISTQYFNDKNLGFIKIEYGKLGLIDRFFPSSIQAVTFSQTTAKVGDTVSFTDKVQRSTTLFYISDYEVNIYHPTDTSKNIRIMNHFPFPQFSLTYYMTSSFVPSDPGVWTSNTYYYPNQYSSAGAVLEGAMNSVTVTSPAPPACTKQAYCDPYTRSSTITNGVIDKEVCYIVDANCIYQQGKINYRTSCNSGYRIIGTTDSSTGSGQLTCELIPNTGGSGTGSGTGSGGGISQTDCTQNLALCSSPQICDQTTKTCSNPECNIDFSVTCSDKSVIVTKVCKNSRYVATGKTCPEDKTGTSQNQSQGGQTNQSIEQKTIYYIISDNKCSETSKLPSEKNETDYSTLKDCQDNIQPYPNLLLYIVIFAVLAITIVAVIIIIIIIIKRFKR